MGRSALRPPSPDAGGSKLAAQVARDIQADVVNRGWPIGEVIGSEAELLDRHGVSRAILREAVRLLELTDVARMRRGPGGGLVVNAPAASSVALAVATHFEFARVSVAEVYEARQSLEGLAAV